MVECDSDSVEMGGGRAVAELLLGNRGRRGVTVEMEGG